MSLGLILKKTFIGNKGGVGISFDFLSTSLCFINSHLTSGNEDVRKERYIVSSFFIELVYKNRVLYVFLCMIFRLMTGFQCVNDLSCLKFNPAHKLYFSGYLMEATQLRVDVVKNFGILTYLDIFSELCAWISIPDR